VSIALTNNMLISKSIADVTRRKSRTLLVILAIFLGVFGLTGLNVFEFAVVGAYAYQQDRSHYPDIVFTVQRVDPALIAQIAAAPNVQTVQPQMMGNLQWQTPTGNLKLRVLAFPDLQHSMLNRFQLTSGRLPGVGDIVLETNDAVLEPFSVGSVIQVEGPKGVTHLHIVGAGRTAGLVGIKPTNLCQGYMSVDGLKQLLGVSTMNSIAVKVRNVSQVYQTAGLLKQILQANHQTIQDQGTFIQSSIQVNISADFLSGFLNLVRTLAFGAIVVSAFLIFNTMTTLVTEQVKVIGMMKAIGGTRKTIVLSYLCTILLYSVVGTILGLTLGIIVGYAGAEKVALLKAMDLGPFFVSPNVLLAAVGTGIGIPLLASLWPLLEGTSVTVREAIGSYSLAGGGHINNSRWLRLLVERFFWVPQIFWLGFRSMFRKRRQAIMTITALVVSGTTFLAVMTASYGINQFVQHQFDNYSYNIIVTMKRQPSRALLQQVAAIPGVSRAEPGYTVSITTPQGLLSVYGLTADTKIYRKPVTSGRWFRADERDVLLVNESFLQQSHLALGDKLVVHDDYGHQQTWTIIGTIHEANTYMASTAVTSIANLQQLIGNEAGSTGAQLSTQIYIQTSNRSEAALTQVIDKVDDDLSSIGIAGTAQTKSRFLSNTQAGLLSIYSIFYAAAIGVALTGILSLYNTLTSSVVERQREIGVWRSMGASHWQVALVFWIESLGLATMAWLGSIIVGIPASYGFVLLVSRWLFAVPFTFDPWSMPLMLPILLVIATLASLIPALRASRVRIASILHYE
jgi:putative ABC transport system permease protein